LKKCRVFTRIFFVNSVELAIAVGRDVIHVRIL